MAENEAPDIEEFCPETSPIDSLPAIHFIGGAILEPQVDPTKGQPGTCALTIDLVAQLQTALAPLQPFLTLLDLVAHLVQCFLLVVEVITNPLKIIDLLKCLPGLVSKINQILALIPVLPQGIVAFVTFIVDIIRFIGTQIDCVIQILESIQAEIGAINDLLRKIAEVDDDEIRAALQFQYDCQSEQIATRLSTALGVLGPVARILCTIRAILSIIPGGKAIADQLKFPDPSSIEALDDAIDALKAVRDTLLGVVDVIEALAAPFGGIIPPPEIGFVCALDTAPSEDEEVIEALESFDRSPTFHF